MFTQCNKKALSVVIYYQELIQCLLPTTFLIFNFIWVLIDCGYCWLALLKIKATLLGFAMHQLSCPSPALAFRAPRKLSPRKNSVIWINGNRSSCGKLLKCFLTISGFFNIHGWWSTWRAPFL